MRVLVVYESLYGNTQIVANCVAERPVDDSDPQSCLVTRRNALRPGEAARARAWGVTLAATLQPASPATTS